MARSLRSTADGDAMATDAATIIGLDRIQAAIARSRERLAHWRTNPGRFARAYVDALIARLERRIADLEEQESILKRHVDSDNISDSAQHPFRVARRSLNISGVNYPRGAIIDDATLATCGNAQALIAGGWIVRMPPPLTSRAAPAPPEIKSTPIVPIDHIGLLRAELRRVAATRAVPLTSDLLDLVDTQIHMQALKSYADTPRIDRTPIWGGGGEVSVRLSGKGTGLSVTRSISGFWEFLMSGRSLDDLRHEAEEWAGRSFAA
jgi:hypothetical protein